MITVQNLKYIITISEKGSITEAAKELHISQPSLSKAVKDIENVIGFTIFNRSRSGIAITKEGVEFLGYARQVVDEMGALEDRFINYEPRKMRFCVSTQHYTFTANAFVEMVQMYGQERYEFILNETQTHQIIEDVKARFSELGILYLSESNEKILKKTFAENNLKFIELFSARPHVFMKKSHPLAKKRYVDLDDLKPYPRLNFLQGSYESSAYAEELYSVQTSDRVIRVSDRAATVNLMIGLNGYTISSGIFPEFLHGKEICYVPLKECGTMHIGYIICKGQELSELGSKYIIALKKYGKNS